MTGGHDVKGGTNAARVLAAVESRPGLTDAEVVRVTGIGSHQTVNQAARRLEAAGLIRRIKGQGRIRNYSVDGLRPSGAPALAVRVQERNVRVLTSPLPTFGDRPLLIIPCSKTKTAGSFPAHGQSITSVLPSALARRLADARRDIARVAHVDESSLMPAYRRYTGTLYQSIGSALSGARTPLVILSGAYGVLLANEPIGMYDRVFIASDWPHGLIADCLAATTRALHATSVVGLVAQTTSYAKVLRSVRWSEVGVNAYLGAPEVGIRGGAMRLVPRAIGEGARAVLEGSMSDSWTSTDGVSLRWENLA